MPNIDPSLIGAENYTTLRNLRYTDGGIEGVSGYSEINSTVVNATYKYIRNGHQLKKDEPAESHVLIQAHNSDYSAGYVYENPTAIPDQGNFTATALHTDATGAGLGRFASGAQGTVFYCNGVESKIYGGDESRVAAFITSTAAITDTITNPKDFTEKVQNKMQTADEVADIGGGNDGYTELLLHMDGVDASTDFADSSSNAFADTPVGNAQMDVDQKKFGTAAGLFDGTGDYVTFVDDAAWNFGANPFTIEFWVRFSAVDSIQGIYDQYADDNNRINIYWNDADNKISLFTYLGGVVQQSITATWATPVVNTWYHVALIRGWGGVANAYAWCIDGTQIGTTVTDVDDMPDIAAVVSIGKVTTAGPAVFYLDGWLDEFRVSKGIARWTADFARPARAYQDNSLYWVVGSTRPLEGGKFYIADANATASTLTGQEWNGVSWTGLTIDDNTDTGASLAITGTVTWATTESTSKPKYLNGLYLYWYQFYLDAGEASIYYVTVDTGFQDVVDIWDSVFRQPIQFQAKRNNKWEDYTLEVNTETETTEYPFTAKLGGIDQNDEIIVMFDDRMTAIKYQMLGGLTNDTDVSQVVYYWDASGWVLQSNIVDLTLDDAGSTDTLNKTGVVSWTPPDEALEFPQELFGFYGYAYKIVVDAILETGTEFDGTSVDVVTGIPAQIKIRPFKFPAKYNNRTMLCGFTQSNQGNRIDYSLPNAPDVFNGEETSNGGVFSLYVEGEEELSCAAEIENQYGSRLIAGLAIFKDTETHLLVGSTPDMEDEDHFRILPISKSVGCPAPLTLVNADMGYNIAEDVKRQIIIGLSYSGPFIFDGAVIVPLKGIENYFDPAKAECINFDYIDVSRGAYDQTHKEYNLLIPSGANQALNNVWLVYDLVRKRWFEKDIGIGADDSSSTNHSTKEAGDAYISVKESKFGTGSSAHAVDGGGDDVIYWLDHDNWDIAAIYSIEYWVKHGDHYGTESHINQSENVDNRWYFEHIHGTGLRFGMSGAGITDWTMTGTEITDTDWHHVLLVRDTNDWGLYLDGTQVAYKDTPDTDTYTATLRIGTAYGSTNDFYGYHDEIRIYAGNPFSASPVVGLTDTITVPVKPHKSDSNTYLLVHMDKGDEKGIPSCLFPVTDTNGAKYLYAGTNEGYVMRNENGTVWREYHAASFVDRYLSFVVETGDFFPADKSPWHKTRLKRLKLVAEDITEDADIYITHYADTSYLGTSLSVLALNGSSNRLTRGTQNMNDLGWSHRLKFAAETDSTAKGMRPIGWGAQYIIEREDQ